MGPGSKTIILLSDGIPSANGGGISQTLYNLFADIPLNVVVVVEQGEKNLATTQLLKAKIFVYRIAKLSPLKNRLGKWLNTGIQKANYLLLDRAKSFSINEWPKADASVLIVSSTDPLKIHFALRVSELYGYPVIPYFMDDWMENLSLSWYKNDIQQVTKKILGNAAAWLMISDQLKMRLVQRYQLVEKPCLVVHNPAPSVDEESHADSEFSSNLIIYAGSIWPMHYDALLATAQAVAYLQSSGQTQYRLRIHTSESVWDKHKAALHLAGVEYGGYIPYQQIQAKLRQGWLLLVTASFLPQYRSFSNSSVQTKLTDYMAAGRPVLYVGPADGASGQFVQQWDCGFSITETDILSMAQKIIEISANDEQWTQMAGNAKAAAVGHFSKKNVQKRMVDFLSTHALAV